MTNKIKIQSNVIFFVKRTVVDHAKCVLVMKTFSTQFTRLVNTCVEWYGLHESSYAQVRTAI